MISGSFTQQDFTAEDIATKIKFNDERKAMEKISRIFHTDRVTYEKEKVCDVHSRSKSVMTPLKL